MRLAAWLCGITTVLALGFVWVAWQAESYINPHPERVVGDYQEAALATLVIGATITFVLTLASRKPNRLAAPTASAETANVDRQPTLEGDLVRLRPLRDHDHDALFAISSDPLLWELHPAKERATPEGFRQWMADAMASGGALVVEDRRDGRVIGTSRYDHHDALASEVEIGWTFLDRSLWGGPWNSELKQLMLKHAFRFIDTVLFRVHDMNLRSQRAVEKLGARRVRTEPYDGDGEVYVYRLTPDEYDPPG